MYSYNLKQLKLLSLRCNNKDWEDAFNYAGLYGEDGEIEAERINTLGIIGYLQNHTLDNNSLDLFDSAVNYLCFKFGYHLLK